MGLYSRYNYCSDVSFLLSRVNALYLLAYFPICLFGPFFSFLLTFLLLVFYDTVEGKKPFKDNSQQDLRQSSKD